MWRDWEDLINLLYKFHLKVSFNQSSENMFARQSIAIIFFFFFFLQCPLFNIYSNISHPKTLMSLVRNLLALNINTRPYIQTKKKPTKKHNKKSSVRGSNFSHTGQWYKNLVELHGEFLVTVPWISQAVRNSNPWRREVPRAHQSDSLSCHHTCGRNSPFIHF